MLGNKLNLERSAQLSTLRSRFCLVLLDNFVSNLNKIEIQQYN